MIDGKTNFKLPDLLPGIHYDKKDIYICLRQIKALAEVSQAKLVQTYADHDLTIYNVNYHFELIGVLLRFNRKFHVISYADNHITLDISSGNGVIYWSPEISVHSNDATTLITRYKSLYDTKTA